MHRAADFLFLLAFSAVLSAALPTPDAIDSRVIEVMSATGSKGMAVAVIDEGHVVYIHAFGVRM
jgi:CubicO group peptidase (beta-lactamase class C family)